MNSSSSSRVRTQRYRDRLRGRGLRPVQIWLPDLRAPGFAEEIDRQCEQINAADLAENLIGWVEEVGVFDDDEVP